MSPARSTRRSEEAAPEKWKRHGKPLGPLLEPPRDDQNGAKTVDFEHHLVLGLTPDGPDT